MEKSGTIEHRKILPRWRELKRTPVSETLSIDQPPSKEKTQQSDLKFFYDRWQQNPTLENAVEVIDVAILAEDRALAVGPAKQILKAPTSLALERLANFVLKGDVPQNLDNSKDPGNSGSITPPSQQEVIQETKSRLQDEPRNSLLWLELSRMQVSQGQVSPAEKSMMRALGAAPNNRLILRAAARLFMHLGEDKAIIAYDKIRKSEIVKHDPWIQATEIALAASLGKTPKDLSKRIKYVESADINPIHLSELASATATEEINNGGNGLKMARKLFKKSLISPNDNVLSQALWASERHIDLGVTQEISLNTRGAFEARALSAFNNRKFEESFQHSMTWLWDEPFSTKSALHSSFLAISFLQDEATAVKIIKESLRANPGSTSLLNNLVVAYSRMGNIPSAKETLQRLIKSHSQKDQNTPTYLATSGLVYFREGDIVKGRNLYKEALNDSLSEGALEMAFRARVHWLFEEINAKTMTREKFKSILALYSSQVPKLKRALPLMTQILWDEMHRQMSSALERVDGNWPISPEASEPIEISHGLF